MSTTTAPLHDQGRTRLYLYVIGRASTFRYAFMHPTGMVMWHVADCCRFAEIVDAYPKAWKEQD